MEEILYYLLVATGISLFWLLLTGNRSKAEPTWLRLLLIGLIASLSGVVFFLLRRDLQLAIILSLGLLLLSVLIWLAFPDWNSRGHIFLAAFGATQILFLIRIISAIIFEGMSPLATLVSITLFITEFFVVILTLYFAFEVIDVMCRVLWRRYFPPHTESNDFWPKVSIHVPAHSEPPEMVIKTLTALRHLDYPTFEVVMVDDNTDEDELWRPIIDYCHQSGIKVFHLQNYPGFKSGALNFALTQTAPDAEIIAVVDSDYVVEPNFLRETVPYFRNPRIAFVQTPQSFRNSENNLFARYSALAQRFFFEISMRARNERNAIIFCGTMGLIRKRVLERIGGWDEWCITEDAEASLRILQKGYQSVYINHAYGHGLLPTTFEDSKKQRFRWAFGGMQILRRFWRQLIPWPSMGQKMRLDTRQKFAYLMGLSAWLNDLLVLFFTGFLLLTAVAYIYGWQLPVRQLAEWILLVPLVAITTGVLRVAWALRQSTGCSWQDGLGAFSAMLAMSLTVARACASALWSGEGTFLRTPKFSVQSDLTRALQAATWETALGIVLLAAIPLVLNVGNNQEGSLLAVLLAWHALVYLSALRSALIETLPGKSFELSDSLESVPS